MSTIPTPLKKLFWLMALVGVLALAKIWYNEYKMIQRGQEVSLTGAPPNYVHHAQRKVAGDLNSVRLRFTA